MTSYAVIDLETTGLSPRKCDIIEIGAVRVENGEIRERFQTLVKPGKPLDGSISNLTGITDEMLSDAPEITEILPAFLDFIDGCVVIAHNAKFDLSFVFEACKKLDVVFKCDCADTLSMSRRVFPELEHHSLEAMCEYYNITNDEQHRALSDVLAAQKLFELLCEKAEPKITAFSPSKNKKPSKPGGRFSDNTRALQVLQGIVIGITCDNVLTADEVGSLKKWLEANDELCGNFPFDEIKAAVEQALADGVLTKQELDEMLLLFKSYIEPSYDTLEADNEGLELDGKSVCLTGEFSTGTKSAVEEILAAKGAVIKKSVTGKLDYLIVGELGNPNWQQGTYGSKIKAAMELKEKGKAVQIFGESEFFNSLKDQNFETIEQRITDHILATEKKYNISNNENEITAYRITKLKDGKTYTISIGSNTFIRLVPMKGKHRLYIKTSLIEGDDLPAAAVKPDIKGIDGFTAVDFPQKNDDYFTMVETAVDDAIKFHQPDNIFMCCALYKDCSDAKKCLHRDKLYAKGCMYRKNLEKGIIFYGKNKNA